MARGIFVFGHGDKSPEGFPTEEALVDYLEGGVFRDAGGRYRYSLKRQADVIVLSRDGWAYGHFEVESSEAPAQADRVAYPRVKQVYLIRRSVRYGQRVRMVDIGIRNYQFGKSISEQVFHCVLAMAGQNEEFCP